MVIEKRFEKPFVQQLQVGWLDKAGVKLSVLRLDRMHPEVSGNKWFKLKKNVEKAFELNKDTLLTFGGLWSNHLHATAAAASILGLRSVAFVRGLEINTIITPALERCKVLGMHLKGLSRTAYRQKEDIGFLKKLQEEFPSAWIIPEGGNNLEGRKGAGDLACYIPDEVTHVAMAVGTGTTFCGLRNKLNHKVRLLGFAPFRKTEEQYAAVNRYCPDVSNDCIALFPDEKWKGFARWDDDLIRFMNTFYETFQIPLDIVYTAKLMYYLKRKIEAGDFPKGSHLLAIHSGGLQGNVSVQGLLCYHT